MKVPVLLALAAAALWAQHEKEGEKSKHPFLGDEARIEAGRKSFGAGCAGCHGPEGGGGRGPNLVERAVWHPVNDDTIFTAIQKGVGVMPASGLSDERAWEIVAFVRSLTAPAADLKLIGDPALGRQLYFEKGQCNACHRIGGQGGFLGPDLSNIGRGSTLPKLRSSILDPDELRTPGFTYVNLTLRDGTRLEGIEKDRTNYNVQLLTRSGQLRRLPMNQIESTTVRAATLMPTDYKTKFTPEELKHLLAFLQTQAVR